MRLLPPTSTLFPYTTLFRSGGEPDHEEDEHVDPCEAEDHLGVDGQRLRGGPQDRKSTRLNSSHLGISYAVFCLKKKNSTVVKTSMWKQHCLNKAIMS